MTDQPQPQPVDLSLSEGHTGGDWRTALTLSAGRTQRRLIAFFDGDGEQSAKLLATLPGEDEATDDEQHATEMALVSAPAMRSELVRLRAEVARLRTRASLARLERLYGEGAGEMTLSRLVGWACREIERTRLECESAQVEADDLRGEFRRTLDSVEASVRDKMPARFDLIALELARQAMHFASYAKVKRADVVTDYDRMHAPLPGDLVYANGRRSPDGIGILVRAKGHGEWDILNLATGAVDSWGNQDFYCMVPAERVKEEWLPSARAALPQEVRLREREGESREHIERLISRTAMLRAALCDIATGAKGAPHDDPAGFAHRILDDDATWARAALSQEVSDGE